MQPGLPHMIYRPFLTDIDNVIGKYIIKYLYFIFLLWDIKDKLLNLNTYNVYTEVSIP